MSSTATIDDFSTRSVHRQPLLPGLTAAGDLYRPAQTGEVQTAHRPLLLPTDLAGR
jgi:hypothetical protein